MIINIILIVVFVAWLIALYYSYPQGSGFRLKKMLNFYKHLSSQFVIIIITFSVFGFYDFIFPSGYGNGVPFLKITLIAILLYLMIGRVLVNLKYLPCPICNQSLSVKEKWRCDYCYNTQNTASFLTEKCEHCNRETEKVFCEHCNGEIKL